MSLVNIFEGYKGKPKPEVRMMEREQDELWRREFMPGRDSPEYPFNEIDFAKPRNTMVIGRKDSGKSAFLETIGEGYLQEGHKLIDLWGATDSESLAWLRSRFVEKNPEKCILIHDPTYEIRFDKKSYDTVPIDQVDFAKLEDYDVLLTSPRFFDLLNWERRYELMATFIMKLWVYRQSFTRIINVICREASELLYSRLTMNETQIETKSRSIYMLQESRHSGVAWSLDTLRPTNIDAAVREGVLDYIAFKGISWAGLPDDLRFMYKFFDQRALTHMTKDQFVLLTAQGGIAEGLNHLPPFHKVESQNLQTEFGIFPVKVKPGLVESHKIGERYTVGDMEHSRIVELNLGPLHLAYTRIQLLLMQEEFPHRSTSTLKQEVDNHRDGIYKEGKCEKCERAQSPFATVAERSKA